MSNFQVNTLKTFRLSSFCLGDMHQLLDNLKVRFYKFLEGLINCKLTKYSTLSSQQRYMDWFWIFKTTTFLDEPVTNVGVMWFFLSWVKDNVFLVDTVFVTRFFSSLMFIQTTIKHHKITTLLLKLQDYKYEALDFS